MNRPQTTSSLAGFVSGGSIGEDMDRPRTTSSLPGFASGGSIGGDATQTRTVSQNSGGNTSQKNTEGYVSQLNFPLFSLLLFMFSWSDFKAWTPSLF